MCIYVVYTVSLYTYRNLIFVGENSESTSTDICSNSCSLGYSIFIYNVIYIFIYYLNLNVKLFHDLMILKE